MPNTSTKVLIATLDESIPPDALIGLMAAISKFRYVASVRGNLDHWESLSLVNGPRGTDVEWYELVSLPAQPVGD